MKLGSMTGRLVDSSEKSTQMTTDIDDGSRFARMRVAADAHSARRTRIEFRSWLETHFRLGAERLQDLVLAVSEAIANAAEFAYADAPQDGTIDVSAAYDDASDTLAVKVNDRGRWHHHVSGQAPPDRQFRGRGIPLMRALADDAKIDSTPRGTHVTLTWTRLTVPGSAV
jgi:serine/threonine-protein kinase RsbW